MAPSAAGVFDSLTMTSVELWCTSPTGFESIAADEVSDRFSKLGKLHVSCSRGVVEVCLFGCEGADWLTALADVACELQTVEHITAFIFREDALPPRFTTAADAPDAPTARSEALEWMEHNMREQGAQRLLELVPLWRAFARRLGARTINSSGGLAADVPSDELALHACAQRGGSHPFSSDEAKRAVAIGLAGGSGLRGACRKDFQLTVSVRVHLESFWVGLSLTQQRLATAEGRQIAPEPSRRSYTTLNPTLACGLLRALQLPRAGALVCDPMCGCGTIAEVGRRADFAAATFFLVGDVDGGAVDKARRNLLEASRPRGRGVMADVVHWDATRLPLRDGVLDHLVTDLPFGKRMGSKQSNRQLYPASEREFHRVLKPDSGSAVLLSADRHALSLALRAGQRWHVSLQRRVTVGGLDALLVKGLPRRERLVGQGQPGGRAHRREQGKYQESTTSAFDACTWFCLGPRSGWLVAWAVRLRHHVGVCRLTASLLSCGLCVWMAGAVLARRAYIITSKGQ